jgi:hypothetical protein
MMIFAISLSPFSPRCFALLFDFIFAISSSFHFDFHAAIIFAIISLPFSFHIFAAMPFSPFSFAITPIAFAI